MSGHSAKKLSSAGADLRSERCVRSSAWAAYGDALGFISELTDERGLRRRTRGRELTEPVPWVRRIGGRQFVDVELPAGCYSDDTQLRLAVGRSIGPDGFDVETFSKIELTVWPSYALGGGKGTKAAAANLIRDNVSWYANIFKGWTNAGGNGAAMRIQPHVWAAKELENPYSFLPDVFRNSICTHGSPNGILGAVLHTLHLAHAIRFGEVPSPDDALGFFDRCRDVKSLIPGGSEVEEIWVGLWERESGSLPEAWEAAVNDARAATKVAADITTASGPRYLDVLEALDLLSDSRRGSGVHTSIAALALLWLTPSVQDAVLTAANAIASDTDTIATMAGAVAGAVAADLPKAPLLDLDLLRSEADRLADLASGGQGRGHSYPDVLHWVPPKTQADALVETSNGIEVLGLGPVELLENGEPVATNGSFAWQWLRTNFGQTLLVKRRKVLARVHDSTSPVMENSTRNGPSRLRRPMSVAQPTLAGIEATPEERRHTEAGHDGIGGTLPLDRGVNLDDVLRWLEAEGVDKNEAVGYVLRRVARDGSAEQLSVLIGILRGRLRA